MTHNKYQFLRDYLAQHSLMANTQMALSAGGTSSFYFDCKTATLNGAFLALLSEWILDDVIPQLPVSPAVIGGPTMGADFIAAAAVVVAHQRGLALDAAIVRKEPKKHGTRNKIENEPGAPSDVLIVEDVITTGGSIAKACDEFLAAGHRIAGIAAIIDREAGGVEDLARRYNAPVVTLFNRSDFPEAKS